MQSTNTNTSPARKFTREEREAFLAQKNLQRQERLVTAGYPEQIAKNIVAYAKQHRGYGPTDGRHGGDWLCSALCGIVYGLKYKIDTFGENEVMLMNGNCLAFLDGVACFYKGEQVAIEKGIAESIDDIIEAYTSPRTTEGRIMYTLAHRCEPLDESKTGRKDFGPGGKAERMNYLCEAIVDFRVTNKDTFAAFYHGRKASPVLEENNLLAVADSMAYGIDKHGREWPVHHLAALQVGYVYDVYLWQHHALVAFGQLHQTVLAVHGIIV